MTNKMDTNDKMKEIILDDELINDYQFGARIYLTGLVEDLKEFSEAKSLIFSGHF